MSAILRNETVVSGFRLGRDAVLAIWEWSRDRLWPIYSAAIVLSVFEMIAVSSEKQILADNFYGGPSTADGKFFDQDRNELISESKKYFHEEVTLAIKERVWNMPHAAFQRVYADRLGSA